MLRQVEDGREQVLDGDVFVAKRLRPFFGVGQDFGQILREVDAVLVVAARDPRLTLQKLIEPGAQSRRVGAELFEDRWDQSVLLREQGERQMLDVDFLVAVADGQVLGFGQGFLGFLRQFIEVHGEPSFRGAVLFHSCIIYGQY